MFFLRFLHILSLLLILYLNLLDSLILFEWIFNNIWHHQNNIGSFASTRGAGREGIKTSTTVEAGASTTAGAGGTSCKLERWPKLGINPVGCLRARMLKGALYFLRPNTPALSSCFLLAKAKKKALRVTSGTPAIGPTWLAGGTMDDGVVLLAGPTYFTRALQAKSTIIPAK